MTITGKASRLSYSFDGEVVKSCEGREFRKGSVTEMLQEFRTKAFDAIHWRLH